MIDLEYANMSLVVLVIWIAITTLAGLISRKILRSPALFGLFGDMCVGIIGMFGLGWALQQFDIDVSQYVNNASIASATAIWIDAAIVSFLGAVIIRILLKPLSELGSG